MFGFFLLQRQQQKFAAAAINTINISGDKVDLPIITSRQCIHINIHRYVYKYLSNLLQSVRQNM